MGMKKNHEKNQNLITNVCSEFKNAWTKLEKSFSKILGLPSTPYMSMFVYNIVNEKLFPSE